MPKLSSIYCFILALIICIFMGTPVQTQGPPEERQNEIQNLEQEIERNKGLQKDIERELGETPGGEDREGLERKLERVRIHIEELERRLNDLRIEQKRPMTGSNNGPEQTFIDHIFDALKSPAVLAAIIGAIGAIIAAWIGIKKRK